MLQDCTSSTTYSFLHIGYGRGWGQHLVSKALQYVNHESYMTIHMHVHAFGERMSSHHATPGATPPTNPPPTDTEMAQTIDLF